jgi:hypothetical protein
LIRSRFGFEEWDMTFWNESSYLAGDVDDLLDVLDTIQASVTRRIVTLRPIHSPLCPNDNTGRMTIVITPLVDPM